VVEPDACGEREEFGGHPGAEAVRGAGVVAFEPETVFEPPKDRLDALADRREMRSAAGFGLAGRTQHQGAVTFSGETNELFARVALVADDYLAAM
jgi:hypothetical protein